MPRRSKEQINLDKMVEDEMVIKSAVYLLASLSDDLLFDISDEINSLLTESNVTLIQKQALKMWNTYLDQEIELRIAEQDREKAASKRPARNAIDDGICWGSTKGTTNN